MNVKQEKRFRLGRYEFALATDAANAQRIRESLAFRYVLRPILGLLNGGLFQSARFADSTGRFVEDARARPKDARAAAIWDKVSDIGWYHTIDLGHGVTTPGFVDRRAYVDQYGLPQRLSGKRCLDIGTWDGFWAFEMERRDAEEVVAIDIESAADHDVPRMLSESGLGESAAGTETASDGAGSPGSDHDPLRGQIVAYLERAGVQAPGAGFAVAKEILGSKVQRHVLNVYDLAPERLGTFDVVFVSEVLLHLRDPQTALENIFSVTSDFAIIAEPFNPGLDQFTTPLSEYVGTSIMGIWWMHSSKSIHRMIKTAGFGPIDEISRLKLTNRQGEFWKVIFRGMVPNAGDPI